MAGAGLYFLEIVDSLHNELCPPNIHFFFVHYFSWDITVNLDLGIDYLKSITFHMGHAWVSTSTAGYTA